MTVPKITHFPVGNGDTTLIDLRSPDAQILIDCNIREPDDEESVYDVAKHLRKNAKKDGKALMIDAFILTHPDQDHCRGFVKTFYTGDPSTYSDADAKAELIRIDELWFTRRIFERYEEENPLCDDAKAIRKEAQRRIALYKSGSKDRHKPGNRLRIIGFTSEDGLEAVRTQPGSEVPTVNGVERDDFSFFVHAPFKRGTDEGKDARNNSSVVLHARFNIDGEKHAVKAFFGGDAGWTVWANIVRLTKKNGNEADLEFDHFLAPHHCSWGFFNDTPIEDHPEPQKSSLEMLTYAREGARVIASSRAVKDDGKNPPHFEAAEEYRKAVGAENFLCIAGETDDATEEPLVFEITKDGPQKLDAPIRGAIVTSASSSALRSPQTYG